MKIFTDSGSDLPKSYFDKEDVHLFPLRVLMKGVEYDDVIGISNDQVYAAIAEGEILKTSQVSLEIFLNAFEQLAKSGDEGIYIAFSSNLSGTCQSAFLAKNQLLETYPDLKLAIIDTKCASYGQGLVVKEAVRLNKFGVAFDDAVAQLTDMADSMEHLFTVGDLNHLAIGGRISKTSAFMGGLLNIKPILNIDDGKLVPLEKTRGFKKAIQRMIAIMKERGGDFTNKTVGISHSNDEELMHDVKVAIEEALHPKSIETTTIGSAIGAHVGRGTIAIFFTSK
ncbi:DegV family protein [Solibacillus sp. MA9]|uniref:DegV family protein n=1 Tax=Solibacillus palustris TaxID=2908203 RepID=A0ABS9UGP0_9BACL|nr:DegV family protein [Solibacillus sp. MA9]MCH7323522.1 DegV family protein [Solibacillus sp. MA9]